METGRVEVGGLRRREQARTKVLRCALELAEQGSFRDLTVAQIAAAAGLSRSAFYLHFPEKRDLLVTALGEVSGELETTADQLWRGEGSPGERLRGALEALVSIYAEHAGLLRIATEASGYDEEVRGIWRGVVDRFIASTAEQIRAEQRSGLVPRGLQPTETAEALIWMTERYAFVYLAGGERSAGELLEPLIAVWTATLYPGVTRSEELRPGGDGLVGPWGTAPGWERGGRDAA